MTRIRINTWVTVGEDDEFGTDEYVILVRCSGRDDLTQTACAFAFTADPELVGSFQVVCRGGQDVRRVLRVIGDTQRVAVTPGVQHLVNPNYRGIALDPVLVPQNLWGEQPSLVVPPAVLARHTNRAKAQTAGRCWVCGAPNATPYRHWQYDDTTNVRVYTGTSLSCRRCWQARHFGAADSQGDGDDAHDWLRVVNGFDDLDTFSAQSDARQLWERRSAASWVSVYDASNAMTGADEWFASWRTLDRSQPAG